MHKAIIKTVLAVLTDKDARKKAGKIILVVLSPLLLFILAITAAADAGSQHNNGLISTLFEYREVPGTAPDEFREYIETMQEYFREIDDEINTIQPQIKEGILDVIQIKAFFLSVFIQQETAPDLTQQQLYDYVLCFVEKEETDEVEVPDESNDEDSSEETVQKIYSVIIDQEVIKNNVQEALNIQVTDQMMTSFHSILMHVNPGSNASTEGDGYSLAVQFAPLIEASNSKEYVGGQMGSPFLDGWENKVISEFGHREEITLPDGTVTSTKHTGLDMGAVSGTPILALNDGEVVYVRNHKKGLGLHLVVDHGGGKLSVYGHTSRIIVKEGDKVTKGQKIAEVGTTGFSTGNHLHLEIWENGQPHNPRNYLE